MRNATIGIISGKVAQLDALISAMSAGVFEDLCETDRGNYVWVMADIVADIKSEINAAAEVRHG
ncbi:TPA: hypothetical protein QDB15_006006 [Burkholderia vietnamiensis]|uniref:hypothetical protein n=1 Tax=Burkholderia vietnamiensis TaxID=60552 RepID=UPI0015936896|nr:hypothetical protein [Burkholderia vietnamiensis]MCA8207141.1 hypothetical protein [Burkholderia vietnamiensis]HDR9101149.1 hypothetical protein [Burkholderia vietnamiensis]HDR9122135.1 hypothetical protein [Burkholderia vietnamiensis]HDR9167967.1 hypothetical protein [Burkholderia vietnamiensis]